MLRLLAKLFFLGHALVAVSGVAHAQERYAVLAVNELCLDPALSNEARVRGLDHAEWTPLTNRSEIATIIEAGLLIEQATPSLEHVDKTLRDALSFDRDIIRQSAPAWRELFAYRASNGAALIFVSLDKGPEMCIFLSPEPRSLVFKRSGLQGHGVQNNGVYRFRGDLFQNGSLIELREVNRKYASLLPEEKRYRFLSVILINS